MIIYSKVGSALERTTFLAVSLACQSALSFSSTQQPALALLPLLFPPHPPQTLWGLPLLTRIYGSALPRALAPAVVSGLITFGLTYVNEEVRAWWAHPFAYNAFVLLVSFVLTFRWVGVGVGLGWLPLSQHNNQQCMGGQVPGLRTMSVLGGGGGANVRVGMLNA